MTVEVERHYSVAAVADLLEVSKPWVYERINDGRLPVVELGDTKPKTRIAASSLQAYLDSRSFGSTRPTATPPAQAVGVLAYSGEAPGRGDSSPRNNNLPG